MPSFRHFNAQISGSGDTDDIAERIEAFVAGLQAQGYYASVDSYGCDGPVAPDSPALNAQLDGTAVITCPNFEPQEGVIYYLQYSDDNWQTFGVISDNAGPNSVFEYPYTQTRKFRISCSSTWGSVDGVSTLPIP